MRNDSTSRWPRIHTSHFVLEFLGLKIHRVAWVSDDPPRMHTTFRCFSPAVIVFQYVGYDILHCHPRCMTRNVRGLSENLRTPFHFTGDPNVLQSWCISSTMLSKVLLVSSFAWQKWQHVLCSEKNLSHFQTQLNNAALVTVTGTHIVVYYR